MARGPRAPDGAFERIPTCAEWRQELADGGYTHVVTTYDPFNPGSSPTPRRRCGRAQDPAATELLRDGPVSVFELTGPPDPEPAATCPQLSQAELDGDSVNADPTANQP